MDVSCHRPFLSGVSLEPEVIPTAQASSFTLNYYYYYIKILCGVYNKIKTNRRHNLSCNQCVFVAAYTFCCRCSYCVGTLHSTAAF